MSKISKISLLSLLLVVTIQACGVDNIVIDLGDAPNFELTVTAQAQLLLEQNGQAATPTVVIEIPGDPGTVSTTTPGTASLASTATSGAANALAVGPVTVTVSLDTNCRQGPSISFASVYWLTAGKVVEVVGKNTFTNYWIIKIPGSSGTCWLWGQYATISGNASALPEYATPTPLAPAATKTSTAIPPTIPAFAPPSNLQVSNKTCADQGNGTTKYTGTLSWADNTNDEFGFAITMPGFADSVGANVTTYNFNVNLSNVSYSMGTMILVEVTVLNATSSAASQVTFSCQ